MSQVDELLNTMPENADGAYSAEAEPHIVVDKDRHITVPDSLKRIAVQYDHNIETVTFDCPRYWDDHDMSQMSVYINYRLPDGTDDGCLAENVTVDGDIMHFDWTISNKVTPIAGKVDIQVCVKKADDEGNEENHWNSEVCHDLYISESLDCHRNITIANEYPDIISALLARMLDFEKAYSELEKLIDGSGVIT